MEIIDAKKSSNDTMSVHDTYMWLSCAETIPILILGIYIRRIKSTRQQNKAKKHAIKAEGRINQRTRTWLKVRRWFGSRPLVAFEAPHALGPGQTPFARHFPLDPH